MNKAIPKITSRFTFTVPFVAGKERPRFNTKTRCVYTPNQTKQNESLLATLYKIKGGFIFNGAVRITIKSYVDFTIGKPDVDNIAKLILDGLNKIAYKDDKQVIDCHVIKEPYIDSNDKNTTVITLEAHNG